MVSKLVLGYPDLDKKDYDWIQAIRGKYDDRYFKVVKPHFTIVFPVFECETESFCNHIKNTISRTDKINFSLRATTIVKDSFSDYTDVFLVPDKGNSDIIKLHDKLYEGILKKDLRLDIPFIPHIGIAGSLDAEEMKKVSNNLNNQNFEINGEITTLDIVEFKYPKIKTIEKISLV